MIPREAPVSSCPQCGCTSSTNVIEAGVSGGPVKKSPTAPVAVAALGILVWLAVQGRLFEFFGPEFVAAGVILIVAGVYWWRTVAVYNRDRFPIEWDRWTKSRVCDDCGAVLPGDEQ